MSWDAHVRTAQEDGVRIVQVEGEVDMANVEEVRARLLTAIPNTSVALVVDLSNTTYMDTAGLQLLLDMTERLRVRQQRLRLVVPETAIIRRVLEVTHLDETIPLDCSVAEALRALQDSS